MQLVESAGWRLVGTTDSYRHYKHPSKPNIVTVPAHRGDDVPVGTLKSVLKAAVAEAKK